MTEKEKIKFIEYLRLKIRLKDASANGVMLMLDGNLGSAENIASQCVFNDTGYYMEEVSGAPSGGKNIIFVSLGR